MKKTLWRHVVALLLLFTFTGQVTWALAGTTGALSGSVNDADSHVPLANAKVSVVSPSQSASTITDSSGHFVFLSLAPDSYTIAVEKQSYNTTSLVGVNVFSDQNQQLSLNVQHTFKTIGQVTSRASGDLVKSGNTIDVYSVNAATQTAVAGLGGGGNLDNAYSAIASVPGTYVPSNNAGWGQTWYVHGSSYSQIGYEYDGIPINRAFDNYGSGTLSNLGQQELQVYTGGAPAGASSQTLTGFINQVIKTGTYPGFANVELGFGSPAFYHKAQLEIGGATPSRNFSYYLGLSGANQAFHRIDQYNGGGSQIDRGLLFSSGIYNLTNVPFNGVYGFCSPGKSTWTGANGYSSANPPPGGDPGCVSVAPYTTSFQDLATLFDHESVVNLHFGLPHKRDGGKDDIQLLYSSSSLLSQWFNSINDLGGPAAIGAAVGNPAFNPTYQDGVVFPTGTTFGQSAVGIKAVPYLFPSSNSARAVGATIPFDQRDGTYNDANTFKVQYQHNIGSSAYLRAFGYLFYSDWLQNAPVTGALIKSGASYGQATTRDYELDTHTRGAELQYANQINSKHLLTATANYTTASVVRYNNGTFNNTAASSATNYADSAGNCYNYTSGALGNCYSSTTAGTFGDPTRSNATTNPNRGQPFLAPAGSAAALAGASWIVTVPGENGTENRVRPVFISASLTDQWKPTDKILITAGLRYEDFLYKRPSASTPENVFWFNAGANAFCYDTVSKQILTPPVTAGQSPSFNAATFTACPNSALTGQPTVHLNGQNGAPLFSVGSTSNLEASYLSPRLGATYTVNPDTVVRISMGQQVEPSNTASTQYLNRSGRSAATFDGGAFVNYGYFTPSHDQQMQVGRNIDLSLEKHVKGTDISWKLTPFYRWSAHQLTNQVIGTGFVTAFNDSNQRTWGFELALQKGDVNREGLAYGLSYSYTFAKQLWTDNALGQNRIDIMNSYIDAYNALTSQGNRFGTKGAPCYTGGASGANATADPACGATSIRNIYYNAAAQPILNRTQSTDVYPNYPPFQPAQDGGGSDVSAFPPHVLTGFLNYKHNKWAITPTFQFTAGQRYGDPLAVVGLDPRFCSQNQGPQGANVTAVSPGTDPLRPNFISCQFSALPGGGLAIPNPLTGSFDGLSSYREPSKFQANLQMTYDLTAKTKATLILTNLINRCFGGSSTPWSNAFPANNTVCAYTANGGGGQYVSNYYNGTSMFDVAANGVSPNKVFQYPYVAAGANFPINAFLKIDFKI